MCDFVRRHFCLLHMTCNDVCNCCRRAKHMCNDVVFLNTAGSLPEWNRRCCWKRLHWKVRKRICGRWCEILRWTQSWNRHWVMLWLPRVISLVWKVIAHKFDIVVTLQDGTMATQLCLWRQIWLIRGQVCFCSCMENSISSASIWTTRCRNWRRPTRCAGFWLQIRWRRPSFSTLVMQLFFTQILGHFRAFATRVSTDIWHAVSRRWVCFDDLWWMFRWCWLCHGTNWTQGGVFLIWFSLDSVVLIWMFAGFNMF